MKSLIIYLLSALTALAAPGELIIQQEQDTSGGLPKYRELRLTPINGRVFGWNGTALTNVDLSGYATTAALGSGLAGKQNSISFGAGIANALTINAGSAGAPVLMGAALGTPLSGDLANCTFPVLNQNTTGSAATLTTARTINGVSFNGSVNIGQDLQTTASPTFAGVTINGGALFSAASTVATFTDTATSRSWRFVSGNLVPLSNGVGDLGGVSNRVANGYFVTINSSGTSSLGSGMSLTGSQATNVLDLSPTWNTTGNPSLIYGRVTNTASGATSNLIDLGTVAGGSLFKVDKAGNVVINATSGTGLIVQGGNNRITVGSIGDGGNNYIISGNGYAVQASAYYAFGASSDANSTKDVYLRRDAAGVLAQRDSTNAQTSRLYGTYTDASNYRRLATTSTTGGRFTLAAQGAGTGASGNELVLSSPVLTPSASVTPSTNGDLVIEATSNTTLTFKLKGSDGTVRTATITLAP